MISSIQHISTLELPELEPYKTLRRPAEHLEQGIFVAEGEKVILRLLDSALVIQSILLSQDWFDEHQTLIERNANTIEVFIGGKKLLETIVGHVLHQSIMGVAKVPKPITSEEILDTLAADHRLFVLVDGITNAENMGVITRNCVCFGVDAVLVLPNSCDPYLRRSVRNSMGNIFQIPIVYIHSTIEEIKRLKQSGVRFYAAHPHSKSIDIRSASFSKNSCIVFGAEGPGISSEVLELCDDFVSIPMKAGVDSLNVASASAVLLWELQKNTN
jgi:tRNA G18 (ribose-2'-O)-methylase SpoU